MQRALAGLITVFLAFGGGAMPAGSVETDKQHALELPRTAPIQVVSDPAGFRLRDRGGSTSIRFVGRDESVSNLYIVTNDGVTRYTYPADTDLLQGGGNRPDTSGLKYVKQDCVTLINAHHKDGYHCFNIYKPSERDGSRRYKFRLGFWVGTSAAYDDDREDFDDWYITKVKNRFFFSCDDPYRCNSDSPQIFEFSPDATHRPPERCETITISISATIPQAGGISASKDVTICSERFGPSSRGTGAHKFHFEWTGKRGHGDFVGAAGGVVYKYTREAIAYTVARINVDVLKE